MNQVDNSQLSREQLLHRLEVLDKRTELLGLSLLNLTGILCSLVMRQKFDRAEAREDLREQGEALMVALGIDAPGNDGQGSAEMTTEQR